MLTTEGIDPNAQTQFGRSPVFACVVKDNDRTLKVLLKHGAKWNYQDLQGETVLDVAKKNIARQCINLIRSFQANRLQPTLEVTGIDTEYHSRKNDINHTRGRHQGQTKSARVLSADSNVDLLRKSKLNGENKNTLSKNANFPTKDSSIDSGMTRSITYDAGFSTNHRRTKHIQACPSHQDVQRSSPQLFTPRGLRNVSDSDSRTNTPRSPPPLNALRVALPRSKASAKKSPQHTVTWDQHIASSDFFSANKDSKSKPISLPSTAVSNGFRDSDDNFNHWQLVAQPFSSPRQTNGPVPPDKNQTNTPADSNDTKGDNSTTINGDSHRTESEEQPGKSSPNQMKGMEPSKAKKAWSARKQHLATRHKNSESLKTAKRRIQISEHQKRECKKKESFEQWLEKKRRQKLREESSDDSSDSSDDEERRKSNTEAFNNWMKEVDERRIKQINPNSAISLHKRKSRALQGLIGIGNVLPDEKENGVGSIDTSTYMHSYKTWKKNRADRKENVIDGRQLSGRKARKDLDALRNNVLAEAVSFEEWMEHAEERKKLTRIISQSKYASSEDVKNPNRFNVVNKQLSFEKWKQDLEAKEAKRKIAQLRKRRKQEHEKLLRDENQSSSAVAHEMWLQKKAESTQKERRHQQSSKIVNNAAIEGRETEDAKDHHSNQTKQSGFESWVNTKHEAEIQKVDKSIRREQQLLEELRHKKENLASQ